MTLDTVKMNRFTLAFDDAGLEREFRDEYADSFRMRTRYVMLATLSLTVAGFAGDPRTHLWFIVGTCRFCFAVVPALVGVPLTFTSPNTLRRLGTPIIRLGWYMVLGFIPSAEFAIARWVPTWAPGDDPVTVIGCGLAAETLIVVLFFVFAPTRIVDAIVAAALSVIAYMWGAFPLAAVHPGFLGSGGVVPAAAVVAGAAGSYQAERDRRRLFLERRQLAAERAKSETLLLNVLPAEIAERLKSDPSHIADGFAEVTILFADIVGFTDLSARLSPAEVVAMLNRLFTAFDDLAEKHGLEKIKTIGDAYMVVGGLPEARPDHAEAVVAMALGMRDAVAAVAKQTGYSLKVRIGANSGPVVAGVIGKKKFAYDLWGDAVNTASRMESHGLPGEIQVTEATWARVKDSFELESRGTITVKGKGELAAWFVRGRKVAEGTAQA